MPRVLVVDDNLEMARMICDGLGERYEAVPVASGRQAIDLLGRETYDAVVTDLRWRTPTASRSGRLAGSRRNGR